MQMSNDDQSIIFSPKKNVNKISLSKIELSILKNKILIKYPIALDKKYV